MAARSGHSYNHFQASGNAKVHAGDVHHHYSSPQENKLRNELLSWLGAPDHTSTHTEARKKHEPGTGTWLFENASYKSWVKGDTRLLWMHGKAGCCKTTLCSAVINDIEERFTDQKDVTLLYFYFSFADAMKQTYHGLLLSLISQLVQRNVGYNELEQKRVQNQRHAAALESVLWELLGQCGTTYLVIDGVDESPRADDIRQEILNGLEAGLQNCEQTYLFVASRKETDIEEFMSELNATVIPIKSVNVDRDIQQYVSGEIARDRRLRNLSESTKLNIQSTFAQRGGGMFRWAYCQLQQIKGLEIRTSTFIDRALHDMPRTLDETYHRALLGINELYRDKAKAILQWLAFAKRPLHLREAVEIGITNTVCKPYVEEEDRKPIESLFGVLSSLIEIIRPYNQAPQVVLAHFSVSEYLQSSRIKLTAASKFALDEAVSSHDCAKHCLAYIWHARENSERPLEINDSRYPPMSFRYGNRNKITKRQVFARQQKEPEARFPFLGLAFDMWHKFQSQAEIASMETPSPGLELDFLRDDYLRENHMQRIGINREHALFMACSLNLPCTAARLCAIETLEAKGNSTVKGTSLLLASVTNNQTVLKALIKTGVDVNCKSGRVLDLQGANMDRNSGSDTAIEGAARHGRSEVIDILLNAGADLEIASIGSPLLYAIQNGFSKCIDQLLSAGHPTDSPAGHQCWHNPLHFACNRGDLEIVDKLLSAGADPNATCKYVGVTNHFNQEFDEPCAISALHLACRNLDRTVIDILLKAGATINLECSPSHGSDESHGSHTPLREILMYDAVTFPFELRKSPFISEPRTVYSNDFDKILYRLFEAGATATSLPPLCVHAPMLAQFLQSKGAPHIYYHQSDEMGYRSPCLGRPSVGRSANSRLGPGAKLTSRLRARPRVVEIHTSYKAIKPFEEWLWDGWEADICGSPMLGWR